MWDSTLPCGIRLISACAEDWARAWPIQRAAFEDLVQRTHGGWDEALEARCAANWDASITRMCELDGALVGWVRLGHEPRYDYLDLITLDPRVQGRGLGAAILRHLMDEAAARGVPIWLSVYRENLARRLYARLGFQERPRDELRVYMVWPDGGDAPPEDDVLPASADTTLGRLLS